MFRPAPLVAALSLAFAAGLASAASSALTPMASSPPAIDTGLDKAGMDPAVRPQDDLFGAMNGTWLKTTAIPGDKPEFGTFVQLADRSDARVKGIIQALAAQPQAPGTVNAKIGDFFTSYMDTAAIDRAGLAPLAPYQAQIDALHGKHDLAVLMGRWQGVVDLPMGLSVDSDPHEPTVYSAQASQGGLGLPDRDYYLKSDANVAKARAAYAAYVRRLLTLDGDPRAATHAQAVIALEKQLAQAQWSEEANRDPIKRYNPMTLAEIAAQAPGFDWQAFAEAGDIVAPPFVSLAQPGYATEFARLADTVPLATWQAYLRVRLLDEMGGKLPAAFRDARFAFHGTAINGLKQEAPRWQKAVSVVNEALGEAVGQVYVAQYFPPANKARMVALVDNLRKTFSASIDGLAWMTPATRAAAHEKLAKYGVKIGYPDHWRDYSGLRVKAGDPVGNSVRAARFEYLREAARNGKPVDRSEWSMTPQTVNAYYDPSKNEVVFPAAILEPPFFDMAADDAINYGAIGAIIGHEISHGFDDQGSKYDGDGKLRDWWTAADRQAFDAITAKLVAQFAAYEPLPGQHLNGKLTLGENIADLSGLQIAYKAYELSLQGKPSPVIAGLSGEQRFYLGFSQAWREKVRDERALQLLSVDPHSPTRFRDNGAAMNSDGFQQAFGTRPGDGMWKAPEDRIRLW